MPPRDVATLTELGAAAVFPVGSHLDEVVGGVLSLAERKSVV